MDADLLRYLSPMLPPAYQGMIYTIRTNKCELIRRTKIFKLYNLG